MSIIIHSAVDVLNQRISGSLINKAELARQAMIHKELLRRSLNGTRKLSADEFIHLCVVLDLDLSDFVQDADDSSNAGQLHALASGQ